MLYTNVRRYLKRLSKIEIVLLSTLIILFLVYLSREATGSTINNHYKLTNSPNNFDLNEIQVDRKFAQDTIVAPKPDENNYNDDPQREKRKEVKNYEKLFKLMYDRLENLNDTRPTELCHKNINLIKTPNSKSIIIQYRNNEWYDVKLLVLALLKFTDLTPIKEIVLVDNGIRQLDENMRKESEYFQTKCTRCRFVTCQFVPFYKCMFDWDAITADILVFLSPNALVGPGWLEPLLGAVDNNNNLIVIPHFNIVDDIIKMKIRKFPIDSFLHLTLKLSMRYVIPKTVPNSNQFTMPSVTFLPYCFAVKSKFWRTLGENLPNYDTQLSTMLELSVKAWTCGSGIVKAKCSQISLLSLYGIWQHTSIKDLKIIGEKHLKVESWNERLYKLYEREFHNLNMPVNEADDFTTTKGCRNSDVFLRNEINAFHIDAQSNVVNYGQLQVRNGYCGNMLADKDHLDLASCLNQNQYLPITDLFQYTSLKQIHYHKQCLSINGLYVVLRECDYKDENQKWLYVNQQIINVKTNSCMVHVTDPNKQPKEGRQIVMIQDCKQDKDGFFSTWNFIEM